MTDGIIWTDADGVIHIRNSERGTLNKCPQRWWWAWREGLRPKETPKALWFGSAIHEALADYYRPGKKRSKDYIDVFRSYADMEEEYIRTNVGDVDEDKWVDARVLGETMLKGYVDYYKGDKGWDVISTEQSFSIKIPFDFSRMHPWIAKKVRKKYGEFFILDGTLDGVYREGGVIKLMEHKTAGTISVGHLVMDNQSGTYWLIALTLLVEMGILKKSDEIREITYNFLRKSLPDERPKDAKGYAHNLPKKEHYLAAFDEAGVELPTKYLVRDLADIAKENNLVVLGDRSSRQSPPLFVRYPVRKTKRQRKTQLHRIQDEIVRMIMIVEGIEPLAKHSGRDTCPMCPFKDMCELHESGGGWVEFRDSLYRSEDPYAVHRKDASS